MAVCCCLQKFMPQAAKPGVWKQLGILQSEEELIDRLLVAFGKKSPSLTAPAPSSLEEHKHRM